ncbi:MAG: hypothetical protein CMJ80_00130 [Planctomycetaceae bacterium]|jgi:hypothetical protein|nr:hypothetical protein [Planctomycetaceae bacterium]MCH2131893.1 hypothetical protein [Pirellulaceae bacterium]
MAIENRTASRFPREPATDHASILRPFHLAGIVEVDNESLGGLGWVAVDSDSYFVGQDLDVEYAGTVMSVVVRHVTRRNDGRFVVGVQSHATAGGM